MFSLVFWSKLLFEWYVFWIVNTNFDVARLKTYFNGSIQPLITGDMDDAGIILYLKHCFFN